MLFSFASADDISAALAKFVVHAQDDALSKRETFRIAISGGSLAKQLSGLVGSDLADKVQWSKWCARVCSAVSITLLISGRRVADAAGGRILPLPSRSSRSSSA